MNVFSSQYHLVMGIHYVQIIGYNDEIIDVKYVPEADENVTPHSIVVATNSEQVCVWF